MNSLDFKINDIVYWNTTGAYNSKISLKCKIIDLGYEYIWVMVFGNMSPTPLTRDKISYEPLYRVTNNEVYEI